MTRWRSLLAVLGLTLVGTYGYFAVSHPDKAGIVGPARARDGRGRFGREGPSRSTTAPPLFAMATASGVGMGAECANSNPTSTTGQTISMLRNGVAECVSGDGQTVTQVSSNILRQKKATASSPVVGILIEDAVANRLGASSGSRNATASEFVKSNVTCTQTAAGMRGNDTNGASTCTATANNGTVTITVAHANFAGTFGHCGSFYIKRRTGTGAVSVAYDGATYTAITGSVTSSWKRVAKAVDINRDTAILVPTLCASASTDAVLSLKLGTSGDAVDLDFWQVETNDVIDKLGGATGTLGISLSPVFLPDANPLATHRDNPQVTIPAGFFNPHGCVGFTINYGNTATLYAMPQLASGVTPVQGGFFVYFDVPPNWWLADANATNNIGPMNANLTSGQAVSAECGWTNGLLDGGIGGSGAMFGDISTPNPDGGANYQAGGYDGTMIVGNVLTIGTQELIPGNPSALNGVMTNLLLGGGPNDCHW